MRFLLSAFFLLIPFSTYAQKYKGVIFGYNYSTNTNVADVVGGLHGFSLGGFIGAKRYEKRSGVFELTVRTQGFSIPEGDVRLYYANMAGIQAFQLGKDDRLRLSLGVQPSLYLGRTEPTLPNNEYPIYCNKDNCFRNPRPLNIGALIGFEYWAKLRFSFRVGADLLANNRFQNAFAEFSIGF